VTAFAITHTSKVVPTGSHHVAQYIGSPLVVFSPIRNHHLVRCGFPETELNSRNEPRPQPLTPMLNAM